MAAAVGQLGGVPVLILKEGSTRSAGREAQRANIAAAKAIAEAVRSTLGPRGMDKMLVDSLGDVTITNDGATILDEIEVQHPAAKMMVEVAKAQDDEMGDGTTSVVVLAGELLKRAEELTAKNVHPTTIISGYGKALEFCRKELEKLAKPINIDDEETLRKVAMTSIAAKAIAGFKEYLASLAVKAVKQIMEKRDDRIVADIDQVQLIKKHGSSIADTNLISGVIIDKEVVHGGMPKRVEKAKIALLDCPLEIEKTEMDAEIRISNPEQMKAFLDEEERMLREMVKKIKDAGANVVLVQKGIDDMAQHYLAKQGILAARRVKKSDMEKLARATGGRIVTNIDDLRPADLGEAELVEERKIGDEKMIFVEGCKNPRSVAILIRGGLEKFVDEAERALTDALSVVSDAVECGKILPGGGAVEVELAKRLRDYAPSVGGREQLAVEAFANALEVIPRSLAENAGLEPLDIMMELRAAHEKPGNEVIGLEAISGKVKNMYDEGVIEPLNVKLNVIRSAVEAASMILRIDDIIAAAKTETKAPETPKKGEESTETE
ncbi:MAG: thermosome subunit beta [Candidatus Nezhaarchaeales archaeon]